MYLQLISCSLAAPVEISGSQIRSGKCVVSWVCRGVHCCVLDASLPGGVSVGCFEAFTLRVTMGTRGGGGKEHNLYFLALCDCALTVPQSEGA